MAGQYSHLQFFRRTPNALLARYFQERHGVLQEIAFDKLKEKDVESIFQCFMALPDDKQAEIEAECQDIDGMACQGGVTALADEADYHADAAFPANLSKIDGFHGAVMWAFLDHPQYWAGATLFLHSDNISESLWKKRNDLPHLPPHVEEEDTQRLAQAISHHFQKEGRGRNCKVEVFRRYDKEYFFASPEDFAQSGEEWVRNSLAPRARHPAFKIVFVYCQAEGSLDIYAPRNTKSVPDMQQIFAKIILKFDDLDEFAEDSRVYVLDALANRDFGQQAKNVEAEAGEKRTQAHDLFKDSEFAVIEYRKGFKNGVYWQEPFGEDDVPKHPTLLCSPLIIVAETRDTDQSNWGRLLSWLDNDGHSHNWACPVEMLAATDTAEFRRELSRNGLTIVTNGKARQKLVDYVLGYKPQSNDRVRCVDKTGWHGTRYVLSNRVYGKQEGESVIYQGVKNCDFASAGDLVGWKREVAARAAGNTRIVFAISTAFAGALVEMANESGGGFQFTGATSKGKTSTVIDPAASVCGHPDRFAKRWRSTANGLEALCLSRNHSTLILDDLA